jgi:hypothetical protein
MFVKYTPKTPHIKVIPLIPVMDGKDGFAVDNDTLTLRPGTNEINDKEWEAIQPHIKNLIGKEIIPFTVPVKEGNKAKQAKTLKDVPVATARKIIQGCNDPKTLKKWFNQELPDELLLVLSKRMRKLKVEPDDLEDDDSSLELKDSDITQEDDPQPDPPQPPKRKTKKAGGGANAGNDVPDPAPDPDDDDEVPDFDGSRAGGGA